MKKFYLIFALTIFVPLVPYIYGFAKLGPLYAEIQGQDVAGSYRIFASQVESGELSNPEIAARINRMANGEDQIASGLSKIKVSAYFWFIGVVAIALLQVLLIRHLLATHNKLNQPGTPQSGAPV